MAKTATQNYTAEQTKQLVDGYKACETADERDAFLDEMEQATGRSKRSLRSKLVNEKVYIKKAAVSSVTGGEAMKKAKMAEILAAKLKAFNGYSANVESVAKMNKLEIAAFTTVFETLEAAAESSEDETESENS